MADGFRIGRIAIEGFKGFTSRKDIDLRSRHTFLLGRNGNGKSSIIEAIRWGLFGSTRRPNDIVANEGYTGRCRVEITLMREGKEWHLRRTLIRGVSGGSDAILTDEQGQEKSIREILPQLDSLEAGEGTHIIFAPQSAPLRRQPEDLKPFEKTIFNHLGLTYPAALLSDLEHFLSDREAIEGNLDTRLTHAQNRIDTHISNLIHRRGIILASPSWANGLTPTLTESENKTKALIERITDQSPDRSLAGISLGALIEHAEDALSNKEHEEQSRQQGELKESRDLLAHLGDICQFQEAARSKRSTLEAVTGQLDDLLQGTSLNELRDCRDTVRHTADTLDLRRQLAEVALEALGREHGNPVSCPVCAKKYRREDLESTLLDAANMSADAEYLNLRELNEQLQKAKEFASEIEGLCEELRALDLKVTSLIDADQLKEFANELRDGDIVEVMESLSTRAESLDAQVRDHHKWFSSIQAEIRNLKEEERYHQTQKNLRRIEIVRKEFQRAFRRFKQLVSFGESVHTIYDAVKACLTEQLKSKVPGVAEELSRVFVALTRHPHFDQLIIDMGQLPRLELQVSSSRDSMGRGYRTGVLNGQAQSALELVPYFALSQALEAPTEVYLVLLDDPTRAFDEEHVEILIERLADLGKRVQLIVGSQETDRFRDLLPRRFDRLSYVVVEPKNWSFTDGPGLDVEYK